MDDVSDLLEVLGALEDADVPMYLQAFVPDAAKADEVAAKIVAGRAAEKQVAAAAASTETATAAASAEVAPVGTTVYRKSDAAEEFLFGGKGKAAKSREGPVREGPPVVGGAAAVTSLRKSGKKQQQAVTAKGIEGLGRALKAGRHPCDCNARRHELLYNCLSCGKVICAQEGPGPCLFCGNDPDTENGHAVADAATAASAKLAAERKERLLEFDRTAAKRTTVIDDQADYFLHASGDAWLSRDEQRAAAEKAQQREEETARQRRELRLTLDFENQKVVRERPGGAAEPPRSVEEEPKQTAAAASVPERPLPTGAARQQRPAAAAQAASASSASDAPPGQAARVQGGRVGAGTAAAPQRVSLINPTVADRPMFKRSGEAGGASASGGASKPKLSVKEAEEALAQGLRHSVCKVQHDNPWLQQLLSMEEEQGKGSLEVLAADAQEARRVWEQAEFAAGGGGTPQPTGGAMGGAAAAAAAAVDDDDDEDDENDDGTAYCLSMHQPWASLLVAGIKRVEGRSWPTRHRGRLWIASTAREVNDLEVAHVEQQYAARFSGVAAAAGSRYDAVMAMQQQVHTFPAFPTEYPTSALLGCVTVTDCLEHDEYVSRHPDGEDNECAYLFMCKRPRTLALPMRISGSHKIWALDTAVAAAARASLRPASATWDARPARAAAAGTTTAAAAAPRGGGPPGLGGGGPPGLATARGWPPGLGGASAQPPQQPKLDLLAVDGGGGVAPRAAISLRKGGQATTKVLQDGLVVLRGALSLEAQQAVVSLCRDFGVGEAGFYVPTTRGGSMHMHMLCLGRHWDSVTQRYETTRTNVDGRAVPPLPPELWQLVEAAAQAASEASPSIPQLSPGIALVNFYGHAGRLGMHQDKSESRESLARGAPVVSLSIGDSCDFGYSETRPDRDDAEAAIGGAREKSVRLDSGDVLVFGGPARMLFHGVNKIHANHRPKGLAMLPGRLNLTFREL